MFESAASIFHSLAKNAAISSIMVSKEVHSPATNGAGAQVLFDLPRCLYALFIEMSGGMVSPIVLE